MTEKKANQLKKALEDKGSFKGNVVKGLLPDDWNLNIYEIDSKGEKKLVLTRLEVIRSFQITLGTGVIIEAEDSIPYYTLY